MVNFKEISELYHHGIKGMKWGVRTDNEAPSVTEKSQPIISDHVKSLMKNYDKNHEKERAKATMQRGKSEIEKAFALDSHMKPLRLPITK